MNLRRIAALVMVTSLTACGSAASHTAQTVPSAASIPFSTAPSSTMASTVPTSSTSSSLEFTFRGVDGLVADGTPHRVDVARLDDTTTVWSSKAGITDGFLALRDVPAPSSESPEGDITMTSVKAPSGHAYLVTDNGVSDPPPANATRMMWWRDGGRLWIVSNYGLTTDRLTALALGIDDDADGVPALADPSMTMVGTCSLETYESVIQRWILDGQSLTLAMTNGGLARQLADIPVSSIVEYTIADSAGYKVSLPNGQVNLIWPTGDPAWWASVTSAPQLADRVDAIAAAIVRG